MANKALGLLISALDAPQPGDGFLEGIKLFGRLASMSETGGAFAWFSIGNINVMSGRKLDSILSVGNLVIV